MPPAFRKLSWIFLAYLVAVILFGAWVRISGAGAGCGDHWPMCNGEVIPQAPAAKTVIEFTHRVTSGLSGVFGLVLLAWAWKKDRTGPVFRAAAFMMLFLLLEGFIGAVLVKKRLVVDDASVNRAVVIAIHLANTLLLTASTTAMAWWATWRPAGGRQAAGSRWWVAVALVVLVITNATGAITALGDTLFPSQPTLGPGLFAKIRDDLSAGQHFLVQLRMVHPVVAASVAAFLIGTFSALGRRWTSSLVRRLLGWSLALVTLQVALGFLNIALAAPGWMQILHLLLAQVLWIAVVATFLSMRPAEA